MALIIVLTSIALLTVFLADMQEETSVSYAVSTSDRDALQAEYMAKSALNLTRMLIRQESAIRVIAAPLFQAMMGRQPAQIPVWRMASEILAPFCDPETADGIGGFQLDAVEGLGDTGGRCRIISFAENSKINVNDPLFLDGDRARRSVAMQLFATLGGYHSPSPYDAIFSRRDADGQFSTRLDIVNALIDWWDQDTLNTGFDPGAATVQNSGPEDDLYTRLDDPYRAKNAPFDSLEELRLVRGVGDDFWATFIDPEPEDPNARIFTIYGSGAVNPNEAPPEVLLARVCSYIGEQPLCSDPSQAARFVQLMNTVRSMAPIPFFTTAADFLNFLEGRGSGSRDLYPMLQGFLGADNPLLFQPVTIPAAQRTEISGTFVTQASIFTIVAIGEAGRARVSLDTVVNFHGRWTPPPPNAGTMPRLGILHYYRME